MGNTLIYSCRIIDRPFYMCNIIKTNVFLNRVMRNLSWVAHCTSNKFKRVVSLSQGIAFFHFNALEIRVYTICKKNFTT